MPHPDSMARSHGARIGFARIPARQPTDKASIGYADKDNPRCRGLDFRIRNSRCWGPISVYIVDRTAGEVTFRPDCYLLTYFLTELGYRWTQGGEVRATSPLYRD